MVPDAPHCALIRSRTTVPLRLPVRPLYLEDRCHKGEPAQVRPSAGAPDPETADTTLKRGTLGLFGIIFFVVAASAPLAGMTGAFPVAAVILGPGAAGMYVFVGIILLLFSVGYATMSRYVTNTGAFFAYVGRGLGIVPGVGSAAVSVLAYLAVQWAVLGFIGGQMALQFQDKFGIDWPWWVYAITIIVIVWLLSALSVDIGAKVLGVLLAIELISLVIVGIVAIAKGPQGPDFAASFSPSAIFSGGLEEVRASPSPSPSRRSSASRRRPSTARSRRTRSATSRSRPTCRSSSSPACSPSWASGS